MDQIAFFWIGDNLEVPNLFVKSIRNIQADKIKIIQLSNYRTKKVFGVDDVKRTDLPKEIMSARLKAYSLVDTASSRTFFLYD